MSMGNIFVVFLRKARLPNIWTTLYMHETKEYARQARSEHTGWFEVKNYIDF